MREEASLRALGASQKALKSAIEEKLELESKLSRSLDRRQQLAQAPTSPTSFRVEQDFIDGQKLRISRQENIITRAQRAVEKSFRTYMATRRQTEMLERLKERHYGDFKKRMAKREQKEIEDLAIMRSVLIEQERFEGAALDFGLDEKKAPKDLAKNWEDVA